MAKKKLLENNPLFADPAEQRPAETTETAETAEPKKMGRPRNDELVRNDSGGNSAQEGLTADYTRASFIISVEALNAVKDYAYTKRKPIKEALTEIIESFIANYNSDPNNEAILQDPKRKK